MHNFKEFFIHIKKFKHDIAVKRLSDGEFLTYTQLVKKVYTLSYHLSLRINLGDRVLLYKLNDIEWVLSYFAIILLGGVVVPLDARVSDEMTAEVLNTIKPKLVIQSSSQSIKTNTEILNFKDVDLNNDKAFVPPDLNPDEPCQILFTSGTWSKPKGVVLSQANILSNVTEIVTNIYKPEHSDRFLSILPLSHIYEQTIGLLIPLYSGASIGYLPQITSVFLKKAFQDWQPHTIVLVPRVLDLMQKSIFKQLPKFISEKTFISLSLFLRYLPMFMRRLVFKKVHQNWGNNLKTVFVGGAPLSQNLDRFFQGLGLKVNIGYGMSETSPLITSSFSNSRKIGEVGKPLSNLEIKFNDLGEILVRGPSIFLGYWPEINRNTNEFFNTNDIGKLDNDGSLILQGRTKNLIIYQSGDKIFAEDIEYLVSKIPNVQEACAIDISDSVTKVALVVTGSNPSIEEIKIFLSQHTPFFVKIKDVLVFDKDQLPKTHTLKIDRKAVKDWVLYSFKKRS